MRTNLRRNTYRDPRPADAPEPQNTGNLTAPGTPSGTNAGTSSGTQPQQEKEQLHGQAEDKSGDNLTMDEVLKSIQEGDFKQAFERVRLQYTPAALVLQPVPPVVQAPSTGQGSNTLGKVLAAVADHQDKHGPFGSGLQ